MIKTAVIISLLSVVSFLHTNSCSNPPLENSNYQNVPKEHQTTQPDSSSENFVSITALNKQKPTKGTFETKGYIAKVYTCPPCPPDAQCKPCMKNNIVISEEKKSLESYGIGPTELIIFTNEAEKYAVGEEYEFTIRITENKTTSSELNDIDLVRSKRIT